MKRPAATAVHPFNSSSIRGLVAIPFDTLKKPLRTNDFGAI